MAAVGEFFSNKQMTRMPVNPMDRATIVSVYPDAIVEIKPTLFPGRFIISGARDGDFELLSIGPSSWWKEMEEGQPFLEIPVNAIQLAESFIRDYSNGIMGCNMDDMMPGLFFIPGEWNKKTIVTYVRGSDTFPTLLDTARKKQRNWFAELVRIADILWARTNGNPLSISAQARMAAIKLGLNKSWLQDSKAMELSNCRSCGELINPAYPVCKHCKAIIDEAKAKELNLKFAQ